MAVPNLIIYLHGFLSSPQSLKAQQFLDYAKAHYPELAVEIPSLGNYPQVAVDAIEAVIQRYPQHKIGFVGSSLGGFLSTYMLNKYGGKAVLINPAVKPFELLEGFLGEHINPYTEEKFYLERKHMEQLRQFDSTKLAPNTHFWVLLQTADETLDYRQAESKYRQHKLTIEQGGDHSFQNFQRFLPDIFRFLLQD